MKVAPIERYLEQLVQRGDAAVALHVQTPPNGRVNLEEQDVELVNFGGSVWLDHSSSRSLVGRRSQPPVFPGLLKALGQVSQLVSHCIAFGREGNRSFSPVNAAPY